MKLSHEDINYILKLNNHGEYLSIDDVYAASFNNDFKIPVIYNYLRKHCKLTDLEFDYVACVWNQRAETYSVHDELIRLYGNTDKKSRNAFDRLLNKLTKYGIFTCERVKQGVLNIQLSCEIFNKLYEFLRIYYSRLSVYFVTYLIEQNEVDAAMKSVKIQRIPITNLRTPLVGLREPVFISDINKRIKKQLNGRKINFSAKKYEGLTDYEKLRLERAARYGQNRVDSVLRQIRKQAYADLTQFEMDCIDNFVPYYENLICKLTGRVEYKLLNNSKYKKSSRLWTPLFKIYMLCKDNNWDWRLYLESQFYSFQYWENRGNFSFPPPNMLYTTRAKISFENYLYDKETSYQNEGWDVTAKSQNIGTYAEEVEKSLRCSYNLLGDYIRLTLKSSKLFRKVDKSRDDLDNLLLTKAVELKWDVLCVEFWTIVPGMVEFTDEIYGSYESIDKQIDLMKSIMSDTRKMNIIQECWDKLRCEYSITDMYNICEINNKISED
jgi:hypothetical protein